MKKLFYILCCSLVVLFTACEKGELSEKFNGDGSSSGSGVSKGHSYVDLGLSVKWATCNVGAVSPEDYGDYFAWGETKPKSEYSWGTYKWCNGIVNGSNESTITKYCTDSEDGIVDNKTTLDLEDDAAHVNWGGAWRMPTEEEQDELHRKCTWTWTVKNGVNGYIVKGPNGNSIFLPYAGSYYGSVFDEWGAYWSNSLYVKNSNAAFMLSFASFGVNGTSAPRRFEGMSVRPVMP